MTSQNAVSGPESDAARRMSDLVNLHTVAGRTRGYVAIRLSDGGSDGTVYDTRADAIRHQLHEQQCLYLKLGPAGMTPAVAARLLAMHREIYDAGFRLADPDAGDVRGPIGTGELAAALGGLR